MREMKALCQVCHDGYSDEEYCFGRCCNSPMVEIPMKVWNIVKHSGRPAIDRAIHQEGRNYGLLNK